MLWSTWHWAQVNHLSQQEYCSCIWSAPVAQYLWVCVIGNGKSIWCGQSFICIFYLLNWIRARLVFFLFLYNFRLFFHCWWPNNKPKIKFRQISVAIYPFNLDFPFDLLLNAQTVHNSKIIWLDCEWFFLCLFVWDVASYVCMRYEGCVTTFGLMETICQTFHALNFLGFLVLGSQFSVCRIHEHFCR